MSCTKLTAATNLTSLWLLVEGDNCVDAILTYVSGRTGTASHRVSKGTYYTSFAGALLKDDFAARVLEILEVLSTTQPCSPAESP
jgi:hypothetical protein